MTQMTPSEAFVETLAGYGVKNVFGIVGSSFMDALDIFPAAGIRFIASAHEQGAGHMADGYARASDQHGVCIAQNGPGITNFVTSVAAAYWAHTPLVVVTPETGSTGIGLGGFQETEQLPIFSKITKYQGHVTEPSRLAELTSRCFEMASAERGPTQLNIPRNHFYGEVDVSIPEPLNVRAPAGDPESLAQAAEMIAGAKFPVIISGGGVVMSDGIHAVRALAEKLDAPVATSYLHNDAFPASHPLWTGPLGYQGSKASMKLLAKADVVIAVGTRLGPFGTLPQYGIDYWPEQAKVIQIDSDHKVLGLVKRLSIGICADARVATEGLSRMLEDRQLACLGNRDERQRELTRQKDAWESELEDWAHERDEWSLAAIDESNFKMHPRQALRALERAMPANAMVSTDIGNICSVSNSYLRFEKPRSMFAAMSFGNCGYAFPAIIGAKAAEPDRPAIAYVGDGAWGMSFGEILTCVREQLPVTAVVFNNQQWGAEKKNQVDYYGNRFVGSNLTNPDWTEVARSMGAEGIAVENHEAAGEALEKACDAQRQGKTTIIEMRVSRELGDPFRRDALRKPVRYLDKYKEFVHHS